MPFACPVWLHYIIIDYAFELHPSFILFPTGKRKFRLLIEVRNKTKSLFTAFSANAGLSLARTVH